MTWSNRDDERTESDFWRDLVVFGLFYMPSLYWLLSVGLAR